MTNPSSKMGISEIPTLFMEIFLASLEVTMRCLEGERDGMVEEKGKEMSDAGERERGEKCRRR